MTGTSRASACFPSAWCRTCRSSCLTLATSRWFGLWFYQRWSQLHLTAWSFQSQRCRSVTCSHKWRPGCPSSPSWSLWSYEWSSCLAILSWLSSFPWHLRSTSRERSHFLESCSPWSAECEQMHLWPAFQFLSALKSCLSCSIASSQPTFCFSYSCSWSFGGLSHGKTSLVTLRRTWCSNASWAIIQICCRSTSSLISWVFLASFPLFSFRFSTVQSSHIPANSKLSCYRLELI